MSRTRTMPIQHLARFLLCFCIIIIDLFAFHSSVVDHSIFQSSVRSAAAHAHYTSEMDGIYWPQGQALPNFASPEELDVARVTNLPGDLSLLLGTLQGLVNRSRPQIYLQEGMPAEGANTWLQSLNIPYILHSDPWEVVDKYINTARGVIVYDPRIIDTVNVATTMAGLYDGVVASPQLMKKLTAAPYNLPVLADLRGKFASNLQANIWQVQHLWPYVSHRMLIGIRATTPSRLVGHATTYGYLRDYAVANRAMVFWFSLLNPTEVNLFRQVLSTVKPGTPYLGWYDKEFRGVRLTSSYGVYTIAADFFSNLTVFSGVRAPSLIQRTAPTPPLRNKIYVTFTMSEGDNFQYIQHAMRHLWEDPQRGQVPLNWSINPLLYDAAPTMLNYYQLTASTNDYLVAGPSGAGYAYPSSWLFRNVNSFMHQSYNYMQKAGLHVIFVIDDQRTIPRYVSNAYSEYAHASGILYNWWNPISYTTVSAGRIPLSKQVTATNRRDMLNAIRLSARHWNGRSPLFLSALAISWNLSPTDIKYVADHLGPNYTVVRGDQFFELFRASRRLPPAQY
ncbi:GxGYxYP domain-containing protein [Dictyobacter formicarum]|uniref:GxGYxYP putative glycoside hydrolase N-terminal domain-containing protein n=1 Tax=Dictyobacter formicarum TaxID=2778368 RepID=A0ABQ3VJN7_9CHLR|nr:GxGYxYP domain-containing protein [Dictyobacter formicarum]GHO85881.1 hypothetical protein KSZ_38870 [Dictyobacter formicarum]